MKLMHCRRLSGPVALLLASLLNAGDARAQESNTTYKCPGPVYTNMYSAQEARDKGCRTIEGTPITIVPAIRPRAAVSSASGAAGNRVDPAEQRARDSDARRILGDELRREEDRLAQLRREFNNGEPDRGGDERNYQKYLDRVAEMRAAIQRKEADVAAIKRELAKLPN
jgi:hypothetical protein